MYCKLLYLLQRCVFYKSTFIYEEKILFNLSLYIRLCLYHYFCIVLFTKLIIIVFSYQINSFLFEL